MNRRLAWTAAAGVTAATAAACVGLAAASTSRPAAVSHPAIVASQAGAHAGSWVTLTGSGFRPGHQLLIQECGSRFWIAPAKACSQGNAVRVRTDGHGGFTARLKLKACPSTVPGTGAGHRGRCYIGVPTAQGVDTVMLRYSVPIAVTAS